MKFINFYLWLLKKAHGSLCQIIYGCSAKATDEYESARRKVATFINASDSREIVFTRNATEAINLVAYSWGLSNLKPGDEVFSSRLLLNKIQLGACLD